MDWLTFTSKAIDSLAWPLVALVLGLLFRHRLRDLIPALKRLKAGPLEAEFELAAKQVLAQASEAAPMPKAAETPQREPEAETGEQIVARLLSARSDPSGVILQGWARVDGELFRLADQMNILVDPQPDKSTPVESASATDVLPTETKRLVRELRELRNQVAHAKVVPTSDAAQDYLLAVDRVISLIHNYRKNLPNYMPASVQGTAPKGVA